ncbi:MAG: type II toxin-antitoxin system prevent-host-death family antitoxin [Chloroflexota bacterium]|nr:type II toxin-antitoxin system prevent-host-death family antitoxin [Chloroflexota bacterium]
MGVKELKEHLSEVLREVEETGEIVGVSKRGRIVARLVPARYGQRSKHDPRATIVDLDQLAAEISAGAPAGVSVEDVINDIRR